MYLLYPQTPGLHINAQQQMHPITMIKPGIITNRKIPEEPEASLKFSESLTVA